MYLAYLIIGIVVVTIMVIAIDTLIDEVNAKPSKPKPTPNRVHKPRLKKAIPRPVPVCPKDYVEPIVKWAPPSPKVVADYSTYINSEDWIENPVRKLRIYNADNKCELCSSEESLEVHHIHYKNLGNEKYNDLRLLCRECHEQTHKAAGKGAKYYLPVRRLNA